MKNERMHSCQLSIIQREIYVNWKQFTNISTTRYIDYGKYLLVSQQHSTAQTGVSVNVLMTESHLFDTREFTTKQ